MSQLKIKTKLEVIFKRIYPTLKNFPRHEHLGICLKIKNEFYDLMGIVSMANKVKSKRVHYWQEVDAKLESLKFLMKFARDKKYISEGFFEDIDNEFSQVGLMVSSIIKK